MRGIPGGGFSAEGIGGSVVINDRVVSTVEAAEGRESTDTSVELSFTEPDLIWRWEIAEVDSLLELTAVLRNTGTDPVTIGAWNLMHMQSRDGGSIRVGANPGMVRFFRWRPWDMRVELLSSEDGAHDSKNLCHLYNPQSNETLICGFATVDRMAANHSLTYSAEIGVSEYRATCEFGRFELPPGGEIRSETLRIGIFSDPYAALEDWAEAVHRAYRPDFADSPPVGWCGGGWIDAFSEREDCWETISLDNAEAIRKKLDGFDVRFIWTSQTNLKDGLPGNWLATNEAQIPSGLAGFFDKQREMGFTPALWVAPFWFFGEAVGVLEENRENLLKDGDGSPICEAGSWEFDLDSDPDDQPRLSKYYLDGTHPKTAEFLRRIFESYRALGVRYYMLDFLAVKEGARLHDLAATPMQAVRSILEVIRDAAGTDTHLQTAVSSTPGFIGLIDAARVGRDFGEGRPLFPPYNAWRNAVYVLHDLHFGNTKYLVQNATASYFTHRKIYINDFNLLTVDKPVPREHAEIAATVFGLGGSPLMLGDDYRRIDPGRLGLVKLCLPRTSGMPVPVDLFDEVYPDGYSRILKLKVQTESDSYLLVAVFNLDEEAYATDLSFARLGLEADRAYRVYEFWTEEYLGTFESRFRAAIPPSSCRLYRISKAQRHPWLLSTDMHVQQGAVEIESLAWDKNNMTLAGTATRPSGEVGNLLFLMPRRFRLINHENSFLMKEILDMNVVVRTPVHFASDRESFELLFEVQQTPYVSRKGWLPYTSEREWLDYVQRHRKPGDTRVYE